MVQRDKIVRQELLHFLLFRKECDYPVSVLHDWLGYSSPEIKRSLNRLIKNQLVIVLKNRGYDLHYRINISNSMVISLTNGYEMALRAMVC